ncbi:hypothetical protein F2Q69_00058555 [Brassica cretica]|uniref:Uncharacterized protein n=1 Tax=Brassica cretica TaxID=69181 RepID=A0A8S9RK23_BRACR|nr:hypothetical protein F2Q69_00058555 [Brassica cretica]
MENISEQSEDAPKSMQNDQATVGKTLRKRKENVPKHLKRVSSDKEMDICNCDHEAEQESEAETSFATQPKELIDENLVATINEFDAAIDSDHANEIDDFPEGSINSWENYYYQPSFAVYTAIPTKRKICALEPDEYVRTTEKKRSVSTVGTEIHTVDFRLNKESRRTLIFQRSRISANTTR